MASARRRPCPSRRRMLPAARLRSVRSHCSPHPVPCAALGLPAYPSPHDAAPMGTLQEQSFISVVIPTLNAAGTLSEILAALRNSAIIGEVIVADGGSSDEIVACADSAGARVIAAPRGRGGQLAAGG